MRVIYRFFILALTLLFVACNINNDVPFPIVLGQITEFEVEGECSADGGNINYSKIDNESRTVTLYVNDRKVYDIVDEITNEAFTSSEVLIL